MPLIGDEREKTPPSRFILLTVKKKAKTQDLDKYIDHTEHTHTFLPLCIPLCRRKRERVCMCACVCTCARMQDRKGNWYLIKEQLSANDFCERQDFFLSQKLSLSQFPTYLLATVRTLMSGHVRGEFWRRITEWLRWEGTSGDHLVKPPALSKIADNPRLGGVVDTPDGCQQEQVAQDIVWF